MKKASDILLLLNSIFSFIAFGVLIITGLILIVLAALRKTVLLSIEAKQKEKRTLLWCALLVKSDGGAIFGRILLGRFFLDDLDFSYLDFFWS